MATATKTTRTHEAFGKLAAHRANTAEKCQTLTVLRVDVADKRLFSKPFPNLHTRSFNHSIQFPTSHYSPDQEQSLD